MNKMQLLKLYRPLFVEHYNKYLGHREAGLSVLPYIDCVFNYSESIEKLNCEETLLKIIGDIKIIPIIPTLFVFHLNSVKNIYLYPTCQDPFPSLDGFFSKKVSLIKANTFVVTAKKNADKVVFKYGAFINTEKAVSIKYSTMLHFTTYLGTGFLIDEDKFKIYDKVSSYIKTSINYFNGIAMGTLANLEIKNDL